MADQRRKQFQKVHSLLPAAFWTLLGALCFSLMNASSKYLGMLDRQLVLNIYSAIPVVPVLQITFARYAIAMLTILPFVLLRPKNLRLSSPLRYLARTVTGFGGIALMFAAVQTIPLASATAIGFTSPIFAMIFSAIILRERVPRQRWTAAFIGLLGALIIASPGSGLPLFGASLAFAAAVLMGMEIVGIKWLAQTTDSAITIVFYSNLLGALISSAFMFPSFVWPTSGQWQILVLVGTTAILGQICIIRAAKLAAASFIAPFFYVSLFYSILVGYVIFDEVVTLPLVVGCIAIVISAICLTLFGGRVSR